MRKLFLLPVIFFACCSPLSAQPAQGHYWQQTVDYTISATLDDKNNMLDGFETFTYHNASPDSLSFLWIHVWPNAFKNDKTAYSEQKLTGNQTDFYFSGNDQKGYINRLDFKAGGTTLLQEDHPRFIDIIKIILPRTLAPGDSITITTPFHVKLPWRFSRLGYQGQHYSFTQWYPKVALYDRTGWHEMPYLEWGEYYNDFGNYDVTVTLPGNYVVAATGTLHNPDEIAWMKTRNAAPPITAAKKKDLFAVKKKEDISIASSPQTKTLHYTAGNVTDFAWFADKRFIVKYDTIALQGNTVDAWNFVLPPDEKKWTNSMRFTKNAIRFYSAQLGNYPFPQVSIVGDPHETYDGMEYPMVTILNINDEPESELDIVIAHETGHNWLQEIIATNERDHAWMDEGMNTFYENKYRKLYYPLPYRPKNFIGKKLPADEYTALLDEVLSKHTDQPIELPAEAFTFKNYNAAIYVKAGLWMEKLEKEMGKEKMQELMHDYFKRWQFKHPYPEDFKALAEEKAGSSLNELFDLLHRTGPLTAPAKRNAAVTGLFNFNDTHTRQYIGISPALGFNNYDKLELGLLVHNYNLPAGKFQFAAAPMFATGSKRMVGYANASYDIFPAGKWQKIQLYASAASFSTGKGTGLNGEQLNAGFSKITPGIYAVLKKKNALSPITKWIDARAWFIGEQPLELTQRPAPADTGYYASKGATLTTVIPQITLGIKADRELYPWTAALSVQLVKQIVRTTLTANYFLNYNDKKQGLAVRFFFGKIMYTKTKTDLLRAQNSRYHFTMYGPDGWQDYTYSNAFADRNQSTSLWGRQIMIRDGGFKYRSDFSAIQPGLKTNGIDFFDNWLSSAGFTLDIPGKLNPLSVLPFHIPLKVFADIGTSASPWQAGSDLPKFLYSAGLQLPLLRIINVYYPLVESKAFKEPNSVNDPNKTGGPSWWQKHLTFSVDLFPIKKSAESLLVL